jgi:uncharacterized repeat protein (TIGR01451 family)
MILAKKTASTEFFKPNDVITYNLIITNPGNTKATNVVVNDDLFHQSVIASSFRYLFLSDKETVIKQSQNENNLIFEIDELSPHEVCVITYQVTVDEISELCVDLRNSSKISSAEIKPFSTNSIDILQRFAKIECSKKTVDFVYLNSDISYEVTLTNVGNIEAIDVEVIDQLPKTFELSKSKDAITVNGKVVDIYTFDHDLHLLKMLIDSIPPKGSSIVIVKGKIIK